jgi:predicted nucleotidyltransferase component of viral defense system
MNKRENFNALVDQAMVIDHYAHMRPVVEKELLHYDILFALDKENMLEHLTFQGGTSLRLCYGASRFSEDLDFAGGKDFSTKHLIPIKDCIEHYIGERYGIEVSVKEPKDMLDEMEMHDIKVDKWQISVVTSPERKDIPKQKIKIEVVNIPAYSREPKALYKNYDFLPDGYSDTLIMVETLNEIMADKLIAFVNCQRYIRYRDIWDLRWLKQQGSTLNAEFILAKINDYKIQNYQEKLDETLEKLNEIIYGKDFYAQISRFIPIDIQERTLRKEKFLDFLANETKALLVEVKMLLAGNK